MTKAASSADVPLSVPRSVASRFADSDSATLLAISAGSAPKAPRAHPMASTTRSFRFLTVAAPRSEYFTERAYEASLSASVIGAGAPARRL